jgi:glycosyltransferase involved in cell wall biosynthesis
MRVSVVVPLYNKAPYLERTFASLSAQRYEGFEAIVVDDGSTDDSLPIARQYRDDRFRILSQPNAGPGAARNRGLAEASGEFVAFLDADDEWMPDFLEVALGRLRSAPSVASVTSSYVEMPSGQSSEGLWRSRGLRDGIAEVTEDMPVGLLVSLLAFMSPCSTLFRTEIIRRHGGFYARDRCLYGEDAYLCIKVLLNHPVLIDLVPRVRIHRDASGLSANLPVARPIEPFLHDAEDIRAACPENLRPLLGKVLATRAFKTACVLGYWGDWRGAGQLRKSFANGDTRGIPYRFLSLLCATPLAAPIGAAARRLMRR